MTILGNQELVSNGCKLLGRSYVFEMINAGKITETTLIPTTHNVARKTE